MSDLFLFSISLQFGFDGDGWLIVGCGGVGVFLSIIGGVLVVIITRKGLDMQRWVERRWGEA